MQLWTIQPEERYEELVQSGRLISTRPSIDPDFVAAYNWMKAQMRRRLPRDHAHTGYPIWAWFQWQGVHAKRPDLRSRGHLPKNTRGIRIAFEIPDTLVLLSDFDLWHYVLNDWYLPTSDDDAARFEQLQVQHEYDGHHDSQMRRKSAYHRLIEQSWEKIFQLDWYHKGYASVYEQKSIQATLWRLQASWVTQVTPFLAR